jgi:hypothetical protein
MADAVETAIAAAAEGLREGDADTGDYVDPTVDEGSDSDGVDAGDGAGDADDSGDGEPGADGKGAEAAVVAEKKQETKEPSEEDELKAIEAELAGKEPKLKKGAIPTSRHQAVLTRERRKHEAEITKIKDQLKPFESKDVKEKIAAADLAEHNPTVFLRKVLLNDPRYKAEIDALVQERLGETTKETKPATTAVDEERPKPDIVLSDGSIVYSREQNEKLVQWHVDQLKKDHADELTKLRKEIDPLLATHKNATALGSSMTKMQKVLDAARTTWPQFKENEAAMRAEMQKPGNERMSLEDAYRTVVIPTLLTDREKIRAEERAAVMKDLEGQRAKGTARPGASAPAVAGDANDPDRDPITDVIAAAARGLRGK